MLDFSDIFEELPETKDFRFQHNKIHLTYSGIIPHQDLIDFISKEFSVYTLKFHSVVNETSENNYSHTHAFFQFLKRLDFTNPRRVDYNKIHPHIRVVKTKTHIDNIVVYHRKTGNVPTQNISGSLLVKRKHLTKLTSKEMISRVEEYDGDLNQMIESENITIKDAMTVTSSFYSMMPIEVKKDKPPYVSPSAIHQTAYNLANQTADSENIFWVLSRDVSSNRALIKYFTDYVPSVFSTETFSYYRMASLAETHLYRRGGFSKIFIDACDEKLPEDFVKSIFIFKSGRVQGGKKMISVDFPIPQIIVLSPFLPPVDFLRRPDGRIKIIYSPSITICREDLPKCSEYKDGQLEFNIQKIEKKK